MARCRVRRAWRGVFGLLLGLSSASGREGARSNREAALAARSLGEETAAKPVEGCSLRPNPLRSEAPERVVAIGDLHGDLSAARRALKLAGAIDDRGEWIGGSLTIVQTGDILDRGDDEVEILELLARLTRQAQSAGGRIIVLNGNHELMNALGDFRYVTPGSLEDFASAGVQPTLDERARAVAPGGELATRLAQQDMVHIVGDTVFVHGGVLPKFAGTVEQDNLRTRCFLAGAVGEPPSAVLDPEGPIWTRAYSTEPTDCAGLEEALRTMGAERMVVGHTVQPNGITSACSERVWRVDVGMAAFYGGPTQVLEILDKETRVLAATP